MKILIKVHSNSSQEKILDLGENNFEIWIRKKPINGRANEYIEKLLGKYFNAKCNIVSGFTSKNKIIEITKK